MLRLLNHVPRFVTVSGMQELVGLVMQAWAGLHTRVLVVQHMTELVGHVTEALAVLVMRALVVPTTAVLAVQDTTV